MSGAGKDVYLHVGLPKTGTTTLQRALTHAAPTLLEAGVLFPGERHGFQRRAAYDLLGRRIPGDPQRVAGSFRKLVEEVRAFDGPTVVISEELLGLARPGHVRRLARELDGDRLHLVVGVRDLARTLYAAWQQELLEGRTWRWEEYVAAVRDPERGAQAGTAFWLRQDLFRVLDVWETRVPCERVHLVTGPRPGTPPEVLLARFAQVFGLPEGALVAQRTLNRSLGGIEAEVVRRLNEQVAARLNRRQQIQVVERGIRPALTESPSPPWDVPADHLTWVRTSAEELVAEVRARGYDVAGDLEELLPADALPGDSRPREVSEAELLAATEVALAGLADAHGRLFARFQRASAGRDRDDARLGERVASSARAATFRLKVEALERADRSRLLGWAARQYLRWTAGVRRGRGR